MWACWWEWQSLETSSCHIASEPLRRTEGAGFRPIPQCWLDCHSDSPGHDKSFASAAGGSDLIGYEEEQVGACHTTGLLMGARKRRSKGAESRVDDNRYHLHLDILD